LVDRLNARSLLLRGLVDVHCAKQGVRSQDK
jgi:hypothetical protein